MYRTSTIAIAAFVALIFAAGCDSSGSSSGDEQASKTKEAERQPSGEEKKAAEGGDSVEVPTDGKKFEPSVAASKMPKGAWHCNMNGKVHYAAMEKGDGRCPVCNMKLKKK